MKHLGLALHKRIELALTEEQFLDWDHSQQTEWVKEHPNSRFAELLGKKPKGATLAPAAPKAKKPKPTLKDVKDKAKAKEAEFKEILKTKTPEDRKILIQARRDGVPIPPAWTQLTYYGPNPKDGVCARGRAPNGKKQQYETPEHRERQTVLKHQRIQSELEPKFDKMAKNLRKEAEDPKNVESQVLYLMTQMAFRIGGEPDATTKEIAYGATNLEGRHVKVKDGEVFFDFRGKKQVQQLHSSTDPVIVKMFAKKRKPTERIFDTTDDKVREKWVEHGGYKPHDIRSVWATRIAKKELAKRKVMPTTEKEMKKMQMEIAEVAAKKLGNKPSESLNTYIDRSIFPAVKGDGE